MPRGTLLLVLIAAGCAPTLSSQGAGVSVYLLKMETSPPDSRMPEGCRLLGTKPPVTMTEAEIAVQKDPYRVARNEAGADGANALLVRSSILVPRRTFNCPVASPITDCPGNSGAWYSIVFESYACSPEAVQQLKTPPPPPRPKPKATPSPGPS
jgi:hypothetical protein